MPNAYDFDASFDAELDTLPEAPAKPAVAAPASATPPQEGAGRGTEAPAHNPMSVRFAKEYDFADAEIAEMSPRELDIAVRAAHTAWLKSTKQINRNEIKAGDQPNPAAPVSSEPTTVAKPAVPEDEYAEFENDLHPKVIEAIKKGRESDKQRIEALQAKVDAAEGRQVQQQREALFDAVDAEFAKMPAGVKKLIGEGTRREIDDGSPEHDMRRVILKLADKDATPGLTFAQKMHKAALQFAPAAPAAVEENDEDEPPTIPIRARAAPPKPPVAKDPATGRFREKPAEEREAAWKENGTARPTNRESPLPKGEQRAMQTARKIMLARGMLDEQDMPEGSFPAAG